MTKAGGTKEFFSSVKVLILKPIKALLGKQKRASDSLVKADKPTARR